MLDVSMKERISRVNCGFDRAVVGDEKLEGVTVIERVFDSSSVQTPVDHGLRAIRCINEDTMNIQCSDRQRNYIRQCVVKYEI